MEDLAVSFINESIEAARAVSDPPALSIKQQRSEERRVGKECRN